MAVKSPMVAYVRSAAGEPDVKIEHALKRKWEDSGGEPVQPSHAPTVPEKKFKK